MKRILLIQCRALPEGLKAEEMSYQKAMGHEVILDARCTLDSSHPWHAPEEMLAQYDGLVIGGSGEFYLDGGKAEDDEARMRAFEILERVRPLILYALENQVPLLGVCFGHQLVAEVRGGAVRRDNSQEKFGSHDVAKQAVAVDDPLFAELPESFSAQYWHKDSVTVLPEGAQPLACGERCSYAALRYGPTAYTVQFHPELSPQDAVDRLSRYPEYLPAGVDVDSVVKPSPEAAQLIPAFLDRIVGRKRA